MTTPTTQTHIRRDNWAAIDPAKLQAVRGAALPIPRGAFFEIKPHSVTGINEGVYKLRLYLTGRTTWKSKHPDAQAWLVTYLPRTTAGREAKSGRAAAIDIYAQRVVCCVGEKDCSTIPPKKLRDVRARRVGPLYALGRLKVPDKIDFPRVDEPGFFGAAIERFVRGRLYRKFERPGARGFGGAGAGPDAGALELAALFGELNRLDPDPLYEELAREFTQM